MGSLYDTDLVLWAEQQARALRDAARRTNEPIDWENVAEEIESLGRSDRRAVSNHLRVIIEHLLKLHVSPAEQPRAGWAQTIMRARLDVEVLLDESPSLRRELPDTIAKAFAAARKDVSFTLQLYGEQPLMAVEELAFTAEQILGDWLPDRRA